jgi:hypothetical protein
MRIRRWLVAGSALAIATTGSSLLVATGAQAGTVNPYAGGGASGASATPSLISGPKYDFCDPEGCPLTTWKIDFATKQFKDAQKNHGTFTVSGKTYTFTFPDVGGAGIACTFVGTKTAAGFNKATKPGNYTCTDGTVNTWWLTLIS